MIRVLLITQEKRLADILAPVFDRDGVSLQTTTTWKDAQEALFQEHFDLVAMDYEAVKLEDLDTFITLDNILVKEQSVAVLMARSKSERVKQLESQLSAITDVVDMSQGKSVFLRSMTLAMKRARESSKSRLSSSTLETDEIVQVELDLPVHKSGSLQDRSLARLVYALRIRKESGRLTLTQGPNEMTFGFYQGAVVDGGDFAPAAELAGAFAWRNATFEYVADSSVEGDSVETVDLILRGVQKYVHQRDLTESLIDSMQSVPIPTNLWEERKDRFSHFGALHALVRACTGKESLEKVLASLGSVVNEGFRAAYFALETDLLIMQPDERGTAAVVLYSREVRQQRQKIADTERKSTKAFRAAESDRGRAEVEDELRVLNATFTESTAYEVFGVWEGCGRSVVQETFYTMVKEHHPDVYGGNISDEMKSLAQEIFITVKDSYQELLKKEKEQTVPPPESYRKKVEKKAERVGRQRSKSLSGADSSGLATDSEALTTSTSQRTLTGNRPLHETPRMKRDSSQPKPTPTPDDDLRTTSGSAQTVDRNEATRRTSSVPGADEEQEDIDVKERLKRLSAYKRRRRRLSSPKSRTLSENSEPVQELLDKISETSQAKQDASSDSTNSDAAETEEEKEANERQKKLDRLIRKASQVEGPNGPNPGREAFNRGYKHYKADELEEALKQFTLARRFASDGLYDTFYAYTKFQLDEAAAPEAIKILEEVIESKHRQAAADAHLFLANILKAAGQNRRALEHYEWALRLNPKSRVAEREVRLAKMRGGQGHKPAEDDSDSFLKKMFKK